MRVSAGGLDLKAPQPTPWRCARGFGVRPTEASTSRDWLGTIWSLVTSLVGPVEKLPVAGPMSTLHHGWDAQAVQLACDMTFIGVAMRRLRSTGNQEVPVNAS